MVEKTLTTTTTDESGNTSSADTLVEGLVVQRRNGSSCPKDPSRKQSFTSIIWCNEDVNKLQNINFVGQDMINLLVENHVTVDDCDVVIEFEAKAGCRLYSLVPMF